MIAAVARLTGLLVIRAHVYAHQPLRKAHQRLVGAGPQARIGHVPLRNVQKPGSGLKIAVFIGALGHHAEIAAVSIAGQGSVAPRQQHPARLVQGGDIAVHVVGKDHGVCHVVHKGHVQIIRQHFAFGVHQRQARAAAVLKKAQVVFRRRNLLGFRRVGSAVFLRIEGRAALQGAVLPFRVRNLTHVRVLGQGAVVLGPLLHLIDGCVRLGLRQGGVFRQGGRVKHPVGGAAFVVGNSGDGGVLTQSCQGYALPGQQKASFVGIHRQRRTGFRRRTQSQKGQT